jgi:Mg/Co/Ni transporter MgtE
MEQNEDLQRWEKLRELATAGNTHQLEAYVDSLAPTEVLRAIFRLDPDSRQQVFTTLSCKRR